MIELPHTYSCFVCGEKNPQGLNLRFFSDPQGVHTRWNPHPHHAGFADTIHGGVISTVLDELLAWTIADRERHFCYCAELIVRFQNPLRPEKPVEGTGIILENRRNKIITAEAILLDDQQNRIASATGKYIPIPQSTLHQLQHELIDPGGWWTPTITTAPD